ncbi:MAG: hypothetical protein ABDH29_05960 [Aquificaceae bacterium]
MFLSKGIGIFWVVLDSLLDKVNHKERNVKVLLLMFMNDASIVGQGYREYWLDKIEDMLEKLHEFDRAEKH